MHLSADLEADVCVGPRASIWHRAQVRRGARIGAECIVGRDAFIDEGVEIGNVTFSGNTVTSGSLLTVIGLARRVNIVFTNNTSTVPAAGPVLRFAHIDGLTVTATSIR